MNKSGKKKRLMKGYKNNKEIENKLDIYTEEDSISFLMGKVKTTLYTTSFPGSLILPPRPWLGLVTCIPESGR